ncbi:TPA: DDE transposase family protein [Escherichia coli]|nr:DDE transposase family protein [Escherichia coli]EFH4255737.1 DDE transposase family protein [Escherichia coli]EFH4348467.1 DDE transposase family protein [Escherichia coli]EFH4348854.1 DDE transposase family protein [Escherichia coli]EFH5281720.1 DDE transposase family protein [Escherichia coli]
MSDQVATNTINWMRDCHSSNDKDVIAIDGKALPHSYDKSGRRRAGFRSLPRLSPALNTTPLTTT